MSLFADSYKTLVAPSFGELRERGSKFFAYAYPVNNEEEVKVGIQDLKAKYPDATHHCYAYTFGLGDQHFRVNDDGEPSNTAGRPILRAIKALELTNILVVVVRYYGGKLLGVPGLIKAYGDAATLSLQNGTIIEKYLMSYYKLEYPFEAEGDAFRFIKQQQGQLKKQGLNNAGNNELEFAIRQGKADQLMQALKDYHKLKIQYLYTV